MKTARVRFTLRLPLGLHGELVTVADKLGLDLNGLVNLLCHDGLREPRYEQLTARCQTGGDQ